MRERVVAMMNPAGTSAAAARSKIKVRFFLSDAGFRVGACESHCVLPEFGGGAGHERGGGGQQPIQQAHGAAADGHRRQLRAHQGLLCRHCCKYNSSSVLALGFGTVLAVQFT
jgi:hypothetical protein